MRRSIKIIITFTFLAITMTGCQEWIEFDLSRLVFGFFISLAFAVIGLIILAINDGGKNK